MTLGSVLDTMEQRRRAEERAALRERWEASCSFWLSLEERDARSYNSCRRRDPKKAAMFLRLARKARANYERCAQYVNDLS